MSRKLRVAHVGSFKPQSANGVHSAIAGLARHLPLAGVDVQVWHCSKKVSAVGERWVGDGIKVVDLPKFPHHARNAVRLPSRTWRAVEELAGDVDLLHFHSVYTAENIALGRLGLPYVVTPHGGYNPKVSYGRRRWAKAAWRAVWEYPFLRAARLLHAVSDGEARDLEALGLGRPIVCVPNGLDEQWLGRAWGPPPEDGPWVFLGRFDVETKGLDLLLDGYARARHRFPLRRLVLAGPDFRGGEGWLRKRIDDLGLTAEVELRPPVFGPAKAELLESASAVLHPSRWEALPFTVLEALAAGRPVLVTPGTNMASVVHDHDAGVAVEATVAGVSEGLCALVGRGSTWQAGAGRRARALAQDRFTWSRAASEMAALYRDIAS